MKNLKLKKVLPAVLIPFLLLLSACGKHSSSDALTAPSSINKGKITSVDHTWVKRQSIGNCWIYAMATWAESLHLTATGRKVNISESYWTYWSFYNSLVKGKFDKDPKKKTKTITTGGTFYVAKKIIQKHGYMLEGDFILSERNARMSKIQKKVEKLINKEIQKGGALHRKSERTPRKVKRFLNKAFGIKASVFRKKKPAKQLITGYNQKGEKIGLFQSAKKWKQVTYKMNRFYFYRTKRGKKEILKRVIKALNDGKPVIMSVYVEFTAIKKRKMLFSKKELLKKMKRPRWKGDGGWHMIVLSDYTMKNIKDGEGGVFNLSEGEYFDGDELKDLIEDRSLARDGVLNGKLVYFVSKNSWGINRPDRGLTDGYSRFSLDYLNYSNKRVLGDKDTIMLEDFVLPPGY